VRDDPAVVLLVTRARDGDNRAWDELVDRYAPLVWTICRRFQLSPADADDVGQCVWLRLIERLPRLREPAALPGWIVTTTNRECLRLLRTSGRIEPVDPMASGTDSVDGVAVEEVLLEHERQEVVRTAFGQLPPRCQVLLAMLVEDPPPSYSEISRKLHMPVGSIGPNRSRCLDRLRRTPAFAVLFDPGPQTGLERGGGRRYGQPVVER
jgi:RNA polymerase sigma factor (sigma-70 family)